MLLERDRDLRAIDRALRAAESRRGGFAVVTGPLGCGRSALLDAVCESPAAAGCTVLRSAGAAAERQFSFGVIQQLFQPLLGVRPPTRADALFTGAAEVARSVLVDNPWSDENAPEEAVLHALHALVRNASAERAVLLVVDDVQWADTASLTWLVYLSKRLAKARVLTVCAFAPHPSHADSGEEPAGDRVERRTLVQELLDSAETVLEPAPLSTTAVRELLGPEATDEVVRVCRETTGGRPAAVTAAVSALHARSSAAEDPAAARELCQRALLTWRMSGLAKAPTGVRRLAGALAVLGEHAEIPVLCELAELDDIGYAAAVRAIDELGRLAVAAPPRFVHPSLPSALHVAMGRETRERLHHLAARTLSAAGQPAEPVAEHLLLGAGRLDHWAVGVLRSAAAREAERGAAGHAAQLLRTAMLSGPADLRLRAQLTTELAAAERDTDPLSCVQRVRNALPHLAPGPERASAALLLPPFLAATTAPFGDAVRRAGEELAASDQAVLHSGLALRLEARVRLMDLLDESRPDPAPSKASAGSTASASEPVELGARVRELLRSGSADTAAGRELLTVLAWEAVLTGGLPAPGVASLCGRVVQGAPAEPAHVHTGLPTLVGAAIAADAADVVEPWTERAAAEANESGSAGVRACVAAEQAVLLAGTGRLERARKLGIGLLEDAGSAWPVVRVLASSALATVALQSQDIDLAESLLHAPWPQIDRRTRIVYRMLRGMVAASSDLAAGLEEFLDVGRELAQAGWTDTGCLPWRVWAAMVYSKLGDRDKAVELAETELQAARDWGGPTPLGRALRLLGMLTPGSAGLGHLQQAVAVHRRSVNRLELARSATVLGRALRADRLAGAAELLATGEQIARNCDASWLEGSPEREIVGPVPRLLRSGRDRLSAAEDAVVELVQRGLNNAQIAEELSVTRRAVEKHLTSVYRKLGVTGRTALLAELAVAGPYPGPHARPHPPN